jgi:hypothetical protein
MKKKTRSGYMYMYPPWSICGPNKYSVALIMKGTCQPLTVTPFTRSTDFKKKLNQFYMIRSVSLIPCILGNTIFTFFFPVIEKFIWIEPLLRGHLSYKANLSFSQRRPLKTGLILLSVDTVDPPFFTLHHQCIDQIW